MTERRNSFVWQVGLQVYMPDENDVQNVEENKGFSPADATLIDAGFWTKEECIAYHIFMQTSATSFEEHTLFLSAYRQQKEEIERRNAPQSSIIIPETKKIITP